jgi:hypothetical protein
MTLRWVIKEMINPYSLVEMQVPVGRVLAEALLPKRLGVKVCAAVVQCLVAQDFTSRWRKERNKLKLRAGPPSTLSQDAFERYLLATQVMCARLPKNSVYGEDLLYESYLNIAPMKNKELSPGLQDRLGKVLDAMNLEGKELPQRVRRLTHSRHIPRRSERPWQSSKKRPAGPEWAGAPRSKRTFSRQSGPTSFQQLALPNDVSRMRISTSSAVGQRSEGLEMRDVLTLWQQNETELKNAWPSHTKPLPMQHLEETVKQVYALTKLVNVISCLNNSSTVNFATLRLKTNWPRTEQDKAHLEAIRLILLLLTDHNTPTLNSNTKFILATPVASNIHARERKQENSVGITRQEVCDQSQENKFQLKMNTFLTNNSFFNVEQKGKEDLFADETKQIDGTVTTSGREDPFQNSADEDPKRNNEGLALRTPNIEKKEEDNHDQILDDFRQFFAGIEKSNIPARVMTKYDHLNGASEIICECSGCYLGQGCHMQWYYQPAYILLGSPLYVQEGLGEKTKNAV